MATMTKDQLIEAIGGMTIMELSDLVKGIEEKFGVKAAPVGVAAAPGAAAGGAAAAEEKTDFTVVLKSVDAAKKIAVIKVVRELTGLGLGEAKALVEEAPKVVLEAAKKDAAEDAKAKLEEAGAGVKLA